MTVHPQSPVVPSGRLKEKLAKKKPLVVDTDHVADSVEGVIRAFKDRAHLEALAMARRMANQGDEPGQALWEAIAEGIQRHPPVRRGE